MNELVDLIVKKTNLPPAMAQTVVNIVLNYLKSKLPAPIGNELMTFLNNDAEVKMAEGMLGGLISQVEQSAAKGKKK